ncbi:MAG TPA: hypothetical protein VLB82_02865 [Thermodesulfobacteriota bacterium]|nr:hypothetical protein [Thermodesulfobacteriota bacterium]
MKGWSMMSLGSDVEIADNTYFKHPWLISIGNQCAIDHGFYCTTQLTLENYVHIAPYVTVIGSEKGHLICKDFTSIAAQTCMVCGGEGPDGLVGPFFDEELTDRNIGTITLEKYANIYSNCTVIYGVTMAEGSTLAANSFLAKDTEPWTIYGGSPAKPIGKRDEKKIKEFGEIHAGH